MTATQQLSTRGLQQTKPAVKAWVPSSPPPNINPKRNFLRRLRRALSGFRLMVLAGLVNISICLATLSLDVSIRGRQRLSLTITPSILGIVASVLALGMAAVHLTFVRRKEDGGETKESIRKWIKVLTPTIYFLSLLSLVLGLTVLTLEEIGTFQTYSHISSRHKNMVVTFSSLEIISNTFLVFISGQLSWWPAHRAARSFMMITSVLLFIVGTLLVSANSQPWIPPSDVTPKTVGTFALHQHVGTLVTAVAVLGFAICSAIHGANRIDQLFTQFIQFYTVFTGLVSLIFVALVSTAIVRYYDSKHIPSSLRYNLVADLVIDGVGLVLIVIDLLCAQYLQEPPPLHLGVEVMDFAALTDSQREAYAKRINRYGRRYPGAPSGEAAMSLMQVYAENALPNMSCSVLRVYKLETASKRDKSPSSGVPWAWETDKAWLRLDEEKMVLCDPPPPDEPLAAPEVTKPKLSKRQMRKRLAVSQAQGLNSAETLAPAMESAEAIAAEKEFQRKLEATEALILFSAIKEYDLTSSLKGWFGKALSYTVGTKSYFKPCCVRMGLLASHYPFRQSTFYCSHARRPVARSASVLRAVAEWNRRLPGSERCSLLLDPTYQHEDTQKAIVPSGWQSLPLTPSHIIDLKPYNGLTGAEYLKAIKYRDQEAAFKKAGGVVVESVEFTEEECAETIKLSHQIGKKREETGETPLLAPPNEEFIRTLKPKGTNYRSLLFLKVDGETVASCVLFRLGETMTSDLQGLDHEKARPLKAYFVMMQHVIGIALREGCHFLDLGPTTSKPKLAIGCKSVPQVGALCCTSKALGLVVGVSAKHVGAGMA